MVLVKVHFHVFQKDVSEHMNDVIIFVPHSQLD